MALQKLFADESLKKNPEEDDAQTKFIAIPIYAEWEVKKCCIEHCMYDS